MVLGVDEATSTGFNLGRAALAEFVGTFFLLLGVVGSGIMAQQLTNDVALQLLANSTATVGILVAIILAFADTSGAHFNPAVTITEMAIGGFDLNKLVTYVVVQTGGGILGVIAANVIFELDAINISQRERSSFALWLSEGIATFGLLIVIFGVVRRGNPSMVAYAVGGYIGGAYWFTSSTSFANPAVTVSRMFSDTFAGIEPASAPAFIVAQLIAVIVAIAAIWPRDRAESTPPAK